MAQQLVLEMFRPDNGPKTKESLVLGSDERMDGAHGHQQATTHSDGEDHSKVVSSRGFSSF